MFLAGHISGRFKIYMHTSASRRGLFRPLCSLTRKKNALGLFWTSRGDTKNMKNKTHIRTSHTRGDRHKSAHFSKPHSHRTASVVGVGDVAAQHRQRTSFEIWYRRCRHGGGLDFDGSRPELRCRQVGHGILLELMWLCWACKAQRIKHVWFSVRV